MTFNFLLGNENEYFKTITMYFERLIQKLLIIKKRLFNVILFSLTKSKSDNSFEHKDRSIFNDRIVARILLNLINALKYALQMIGWRLKCRMWIYLSGTSYHIVSVKKIGIRSYTNSNMIPFNSFDQL